MAYKISDECIACGACEAECPVSAISEGDGKYEINPAPSAAPARMSARSAPLRRNNRDDTVAGRFLQGNARQFV